MPERFPSATSFPRTIKTPGETAAPASRTRHAQPLDVVEDERLLCPTPIAMPALGDDVPFSLPTISYLKTGSYHFLFMKP
jgi:hypothetical protein